MEVCGFKSHLELQFFSEFPFNANIYNVFLQKTHLALKCHQKKMFKCCHFLPPRNSMSFQKVAYIHTLNLSTVKTSVTIAHNKTNLIYWYMLSVWEGVRGGHEAIYVEVMWKAFIRKA